MTSPTLSVRRPLGLTADAGTHSRPDRLWLCLSSQRVRFSKLVKTNPGPSPLTCPTLSLLSTTFLWEMTAGLTMNVWVLWRNVCACYIVMTYWYVAFEKGRTSLLLAKSIQKKFKNRLNKDPNRYILTSNLST